MIAVEHGRYERDGFKLAIELAVPPTSCTAVLGPSGAGKSTLLNILAGFESLKTGTIMLDGCIHNQTQPWERPINFIFQDNNSFAHITARNNVAFGVSPALNLSPTQWKDVDDAMQQVGILHLRDRKPGEMSGGERQRIALARALVRPKPILLLDEAFAALGPALRHDMLNQVKDLQARYSLTVLMVTHQPEDAKRIADHVIFVDSGLVHPAVSTAQFFASDAPGIRDYLGQAALPA